jgi:hypothetical protein
MLLSELISATRRRIKSGVATEDTINLLQTDYTPGQGTLTFQYPLQGLSEGTRISCGLNTFHVWGVSATAKTATVTVGVDGSPDNVLLAGTIVRVKPRWTDFEILDDLNSDIIDLSTPLHGLFQVLSLEFPYNQAIQGYDLQGVDPLGILEVNYATPGPDKAWPSISMRDWKLDRAADSTDFTSGISLRITAAAYSGQSIKVVYKAAFNPLGTDLTMDISTTGLPVTAYDLPPLGAAIRLQSGIDIERTRLDTQGDTRRADEVPVQSPGLAVKLLKDLRQERINAEQGRLRAKWPVRSR